METIAVYWESKIKTYGFALYRDLSMAVLPLGLEEMGRWAQELGDPRRRAVPFHLVLLQPDGGGAHRLTVIVPQRDVSCLATGPARDPDLNGAGGHPGVTPVEMIHFQGPHYGDRYGIAHTALQTLKNGNISLLAVACSSASIYLVLPPGRGDEAKSLLDRVFEVPRRRTYCTAT